MTPVFKNNAALKEYYGTSDSQAFYTANSAALHARTLKDKTVTHYIRDQKAPAVELSEMNTTELKEFALSKGLVVTKTRKTELLEEINTLLSSSTDESTNTTQTEQ